MEWSKKNKRQNKISGANYQIYVYIIFFSKITLDLVPLIRKEHSKGFNLSLSDDEAESIVEGYQDHLISSLRLYLKSKVSIVVSFFSSLIYCVSEFGCFLKVFHSKEEYRKLFKGRWTGVITIVLNNSKFVVTF